MRFWDSSALVPLFLDEPRSSSVHALFEHDPRLMVWWASRVECTSAMARAARDGRLDMPSKELARERRAEMFDGADEIAPGEEVRARAERLLALHPLRAGDALQLGAAIIWARERTVGQALVSLDERLREAARKEGFSVLP